MTSLEPRRPADLVVVGAGIVGLAHAVEALDRGLAVTVVERNEVAVGASVRNFGHGCITAQSGDALGYALAARQSWLRLAKDAGFWLRDTGTLVVARADDERAVLEELRDLRGDDVVLLDAAAIADRVHLTGDVVGGAWLPLDIRVDARTAVGAIAAWLAERGVRFVWDTAVTGVEPGAVHTTRGTIATTASIVAVGHDVDRLFPGLAAEHGVRRCTLRMMRVRDPQGSVVDPALLTGHSMLRYSAFEQCASLAAVRVRLGLDDPAAVENGLNLMFTQRPDGTLTIGDTHTYATTPSPFDDESLDRLVLDRTADLLGVADLDVLERWRGVYASAPEPFLVAAPTSHTRVVSVTSGIGMTTGLGLGAAVVDELLSTAS